MKTITATVVYPVYIEVEVQDNASEKEMLDAIWQAADEAHKGEAWDDPIITECSDPDLELE